MTKGGMKRIVSTVVKMISCTSIACGVEVPRRIFNQEELKNKKTPKYKQKKETKETKETKEEVKMCCVCFLLISPFYKKSVGT
jgi:hypothetical protein